MIKNVIFDMGNVLIRWDPEYIISHYSDDKDERKMLLDAIIRHPDWLENDGGFIDENILLSRVKTRLDVKYHALAADIIDTFDRWMFSFDGIDAALAELKKRGYGLYVLSNSCPRFRGKIEAQTFSEYLDGIVISSEEKMLKPDVKLFDLAVGRFGIDRKETVFIDDIKENVEGAIKAGLGGILYNGQTETPDALVRKITEYGGNI